MTQPATQTADAAPLDGATPASIETATTPLSGPTMGPPGRRPWRPRAGRRMTSSRMTCSSRTCPSTACAASTESRA